jgi:spore germination protein KC
MTNKTKQRIRNSGDYMKLNGIIGLSITLLILSGCWNSREINELSISIAIGIDKTERGYRITQQILNPKAISTKIYTNETPIILFSEEGENVFSIIRQNTAEFPRKIYNSHVRMVVFGEDMARNGIQDVLDFLLRDHEFRTDFYFAIAKGTTASEVLSILTPLEFIPGIRLYNSLENSESYLGITQSVDILDLVQCIISDGKNPALPGIEITTGEKGSDTLDVLTTVSGKKGLKYIDMGVFKDDKLIGWLSEDESKGFNYIVGNVKNNIEYTHYNEKDQITYEIIDSAKKITTSVVNQKPSLLVEIRVKANIGAVDGYFDIMKKENESMVVNLLENRLQEFCESALRKAQTELHSDIFGFGEVIHVKYPKLWKEIKSNWSVEFSRLPVEFDVTVELNKTGEISKSVFTKEES